MITRIRDYLWYSRWRGRGRLVLCKCLKVRVEVVVPGKGSSVRGVNQRTMCKVSHCASGSDVLVRGCWKGRGGHVVNGKPHTCVA